LNVPSLIAGPPSVYEHVFAMVKSMDEEPRREVRRGGPTRLSRVLTEPVGCASAYVDEFDRTWYCGHAKHPSAYRHQAWLYTDPQGVPGEVGWDHRLEWSDRW
jgi:hypothetical protein